ncbi:tetratricopeptide repeat protein [bacterium]|nr:tetratricopeptide repeat protein [bacterium]
MKKLFILIMLISLSLCSAVNADEMTKSQQAMAYYNDNNIEQAIKILESIPENDKNAQDWLLMGNLLQDKNKNAEAVFMFKRAILVDKNYYKPYYNLANIYLEEDRPLMAIDNYKNVIRLKRDFAYAYYNIGCAYLKLGDYKKAKKYFAKAVELKNTEPDFQYNLAFCYKKLNKLKLASRHLEFYNKLLETN